MILADTSVWVDYFNGNVNTATDALDRYLEVDTVAMGDLVFLEILHGFRHDKDFKKAKTALQSLGQYEVFNSELALKCADNYRHLSKKGITIRRTTDVMIATFCIENKLPLLFSDRDFLPFVKHLKLISALNAA